MKPRTLTAVVWLGIGWLLFALSLNSNTASKSLLDQVRYNLNRIKPFKVNFVQRVFLEGELEIEESGEILFKDSAELKWTYMVPDYKVFILKKDRYRFFDRENNQLMKGEITATNQKWIWQLLFTKEISEHVTFNDQERVITINWEKEELKFQVYIGSGGLPIKVVQHDVSGARYDYLFENYQASVKLSQSDFEINLPKDVEIIDGDTD